MPSNIAMFSIAGVLLFIFYVPPTWIAYRNTQFCMSLRVIFSITIVPLFFILMIKNYWIVADHFPGLVDLFNSVPDSRKSGKPASILAFFITCPLAVLGCYCWFKLLKFIDSKLGNKPKGQCNLDIAKNESQAIWLGIFSLSLILSMILGSALINLLIGRGIQITPINSVPIYFVLPALVVGAFIRKCLSPIKEQSNKR
jgi:hypothetical protein